MVEARRESRASGFTKIKQAIKKINSRLRVKYRKLMRRCPRQLRGFGGPLLGGMIGLIGGIPGFIIGLLMGYLLSKLFVQSIQDWRILDYLENPGKQEFYEGESGLAAWCALNVLVASENSVLSSVNRIRNPLDKKSGSSISDPLAEKMLRQVILETSHTFTGPLADPYLIEHFSQLAWSHKESLNPDLLAESLAARRSSQGDLVNLGRVLYNLAEGEEAKELAGQICRILDPEWDIHPHGPAGETSYGNANGNSGAGIQRDPWKILGLPQGTPNKEVKAHYRRLAKQFHPDELEVLDERHRQAATRAFIAIKEAYKEITGEQ